MIHPRKLEAEKALMKANKGIKILIKDREFYKTEYEKLISENNRLRNKLLIQENALFLTMKIIVENKKNVTTLVPRTIIDQNEPETTKVLMEALWES